MPCEGKESMSSCHFYAHQPFLREHCSPFRRNSEGCVYERGRSCMAAENLSSSHLSFPKKEPKNTAKIARCKT